METKYIQVYTTVEKITDAERISRAIVEKKLAACAQITGPIISEYWWEGKMEKGEEYVLVMKTKAGLYDELEAAIKLHHTYDVPEIIALPIIRGNEKYLDWIGENTL